MPHLAMKKVYIPLSRWNSSCYMRISFSFCVLFKRNPRRSTTGEISLGVILSKIIRYYKSKILNLKTWVKFLNSLSSRLSCECMAWLANRSEMSKLWAIFFSRINASNLMHANKFIKRWRLYFTKHYIPETRIFTK